WTATDASGNTATCEQTVTVTDNMPPVFAETLPVNGTFECNDIPNVAILTATDNCGTVEVTFNEVRKESSCIYNYSLERTWTATNRSGITTIHTQIITVQDTKAPVLATALQTSLSVNCDNIPVTPSLQFTDNCSATVDVKFSETNSYNETTKTDYEIVRTWTVKDACDNEAVFTQTIAVTLKNTVTQVSDRACTDDGTIDLNDYLTTNPSNGTWIITEGTAVLDDTIFNPEKVALGNYKFSYTSSANGCLNTTEVTIEIHNECIVLPCDDGKGMVISKVITPNGDTHNEFFTIKGIEFCNFIVELQIFNRWGAKIYENFNYKNDWNGFASSASVGKADKVPNGTYFYIINLKNSGLKPFSKAFYVGTK
ncbi:gliding motility-associated C-terminal domain-containing protein, partial [Mariniflexile sp.]|uniref:gliding motility-associated C-terminal domain-containing protein n=1 Tax=Mariniflexile sp. TaxID=1979402 RepID=UPI00404775E2